MKSVFSLPVYLQGLKRIRAIGSCMAIFLVLINLIMTAQHDFDSFWWGDKCKYCEKGLDHFKLFTTDFMVVLVIIVPFVTYNMFSYLNKRYSADFYHSLPLKRSAVFVSHWAATLTWCFGSVALFVAVNSAYWIAMGGPLHFYLWFNTLICTCALVLFLSACTALGVMLTGNAFSATAATAAIAWLPYFVMSFFEYGVKHQFPRIVPEMTILKYIGREQFLPTGPFMARIGWGDRLGSFDIDGGLLVNVLFSLVLGALACLAYVKRNSEVATRPSSSKAAQHFIRGAIAFPVVLMAIDKLFTATDSFLVMDEYESWVIADWVIEAAQWLSAAFVIYLLYELVVTRSFKSVIKAAPWFLTVLAAGGLLIGAINLTAAVMRFNDPKDPAEIKSAVLYGDFLIDGLTVYNDDGISLKEEKLIEMITEDHMISSGGRTVQINYKNGKTVYRKMALNAEFFTELEKYVMADSELNRIVLPLPEWEDIRPNSCNPKIDKAFWDTFTEEYYKLGPKDRRKIAQHAYGELYGTKYEIVSVEHKEIRYDYWTTSNYYTDAKRTPKSYKLLKEMKKGEQG